MLKINFIKYIILVILFTTTISSNIYANKIIELEPIKISNKLFFYDADGETHTLEEYDNEVVLLVFWAKWCVSCTQSLIALNELQNDFKKLPFKIITISEDYQGVSLVKQLCATHKINNLKIFFDYKNGLMKALNVATIPTAFLIDKQCNMIVSFVGVINWNDEDIRKILLSYLNNDNKINN